MNLQEEGELETALEERESLDLVTDAPSSDDLVSTVSNEPSELVDSELISSDDDSDSTDSGSSDSNDSNSDDVTNVTSDILDEEENYCNLSIIFLRTKVSFLILRLMQIYQVFL
ncbi:hypothetical protein BDCR2A_01413 [Borrelia duttonii CR2A]|uniref:Uncharacterized protein n=1 Tax=Borrelia duttonii CR2A TaxID=1432657 RepID=W6TKA7_9SPIR|nr:hypothetical protein [Borrelia duttonii]ETZ17669.1 hypothetical protein BDCR2A_01413 [Borrelia duttonii CR2A]